ncbi:hypothetical protein CTA1_4669 [Colletotrichum tanaceti]|uniref:Uncharacterized protein n=1 Tax=Colletotrichum tanaceti TaxID=1306861 RepID=A0A4U6X060_9PEZI|nr:hypothetical protein CTA1_4669 [Colletotrichum tanaceti]
MGSPGWANDDPGRRQTCKPRSPRHRGQGARLLRPGTPVIPKSLQDLAARHTDSAHAPPPKGIWHDTAGARQGSRVGSAFRRRRRRRCRRRCRRRSPLQHARAYADQRVLQHLQRAEARQHPGGGGGSLACVVGSPGHSAERKEGRSNGCEAGIVKTRKKKTPGSGPYKR